MIKEKSELWKKCSHFLGRMTSKLPFGPNLYSWITLPLAIFGFLAIKEKIVIYGVFLFLASGFFDLCDGACARFTGRESHYGAFLDGTLDRFVDFLLISSYVYLPLLMPGPDLTMWVLIANFVVILPSFIVAYANHRKALYDPDETINWRFLNRGEMFVLMLLIPITSVFSPIIASYTLVGLVGLCILTIVQTMVRTSRLSNS